MRADTTIDKEPSVAIYTKPLNSLLTSDEKVCLSKVKHVGFGKTDGRPLMDEGKTGTTITGNNSRRRKCVLVYLSKLSSGLVKDMKKGKRVV